MDIQAELPLSEAALDYKERCPAVSGAEVRKIAEVIPGLEYKLDYITEEQEENLLRWTDKRKWITDLRRRVQHYGWRYDYKARKVGRDMRIGDLPGPLAGLAEKLHADGLIDCIPDQAIVNEYEPGQGIARHVDCEPCFGDTIITISLSSGCVMEFTEAERVGNRLDFKKPTDKVVPVWLEPRSVVSMREDSRWWWFHGIPARRSDEWKGERYRRGRRVSLTFRKVVLDG